MPTVKTHKFIFAGDVVCESRPEPDPTLLRLLERADMACCNVEAPLQGVGSPIAKTGPLVQQHHETPGWLTGMGFNCFSLANNHINDFGPEALNHTRRAFSKQIVLGVGSAEEAYQLRQVELGGVRYGLLAYGENGYGALNGDRQCGHAWVNHPRVDQDIPTYRKMVDCLIIQVHAGVELWDIPIPEWRDRYRELIDLGADIIIGHHPHRIQGVEEYRGKPIFYSLGNFYFDASNQPDGWNQGGLLELEFQEGKLVSQQLHLVEKHDTRLSLIDATESGEQLSQLNQKLIDPNFLARINKKALLEWEKHHATYYASPFNGMSRYSLLGIAKHVKRMLFNRQTNYNMIWHNLFIESNRWLVERAIRSKAKLK